MPTPLELAEAFIEAGELPDALEALNHHLDAHPDDQSARRLRIDVLLRLPGHEREALADLKALPELTDEDTIKRFGLLGTTDELEAALKRSLCAGDMLPLADLMLCRLYKVGASDRALALLADLPKTWRLLGWSGDFYALKGEDAVAAEHFCSALDQLGQVDNALLELQRAALLLKRGAAYHRLRRYAEADADYQSAEAIIPNDPMIPFNRGLLIFEQSGLRRALPLCRDALDHASQTMRDHMRDLLMNDARYHVLAQALLS